MARPMRAVSLALVAIGAMIASPLLADSDAAAIGVPSHNTAPGHRFMRACFRVSATEASQDRCDAAAVRAFDRVRAGEGVGPITLPAGFDVMPAAEQLLVISNLERVDRGLRPVSARTVQLDALARNGAERDTDPPPPNPMPSGAAAASLWAGAGTSVLLDDFYWMYDDGPGSGNVDCRHATDPGCWGHRRGILTPYEAPLYMGGASVRSAAFGASVAEEFVGGGASESTDYTPTGLSWASITHRVPVGIGRTRIALASDRGIRRGTLLRLWASGEPMTVNLAITHGARQWSVNRASCTLAAGSTCTVTVAYQPTSTAPVPGALQVAGPNGTQTVRLHGRQAAPVVTLAPASRTVAPRHHADLLARVRAAYSHRDRSGVVVELQRRRPGHKHWHVIARRVSGPLGGAHFRPKPSHSASYRVVALGSGGFPHGTSRTVTIRVS